MTTKLTFSVATATADLLDHGDPTFGWYSADEIKEAHRQCVRLAQHVDGDRRMFWINGAAAWRKALVIRNRYLGRSDIDFGTRVGSA